MKKMHVRKGDDGWPEAWTPLPCGHTRASTTAGFMCWTCDQCDRRFRASRSGPIFDLVLYRWVEQPPRQALRSDA